MEPLNFIPLPPENLSEDEAMIYTDICMARLHGEGLYREQLSDIERLARVDGERERLIEDLGLRADSKAAEFEPIPDYFYLADPEQFDKRFASYLSKFDTQKSAYQAVEQEYKMSFQDSKYSNYESYRVARSHRLNKET